VRAVKKIAVVGSGPVGSVIAMKLLASLPVNSQIHLIEAAKDEVNLDSLFLSQKNSVNGRIMPSEFLRNLKEEGRDPSQPKLIGGYSNVWGATWKSPSGSDLSLTNAYCELEDLLAKIQGQFGKIHFSTVIRKGISLCNCMSPHLAKESGELSKLLYESTLLLNELRFAPEDSKEDTSWHIPWNSRTAVQFLRSYCNFTLKPNTWVERFEETPDAVVLHTSQGKLEFDLAIFACGPIETAKLLLRSLPNLSQIQLVDTQMTYSMILRWPHNNSQSDFGLSHLASDIKINGKSPVTLHTQYYAHLYKNRELVLRRIPRILSMPVTLLLRLLDPFLVVAINYISAHVSGTVIIKKDENCGNEIRTLRILSKNHKREFAKIYRLFSRKIRKLGLFTTQWFTFHQAPGKSFHYGADTSITSSNTGKVIGCSRSYVSGAICLSEIYPQPITTTAMAHGIIIANKIINEII